MNSLIKIAVSLAFVAVLSGNLQWILYQARKAQIKLIIDSQASNWLRVIRQN